MAESIRASLFTGNALVTRANAVLTSGELGPFTSVVIDRCIARRVALGADLETAIAAKR